MLYLTVQYLEGKRKIGNKDARDIKFYKYDRYSERYKALKECKEILIKNDTSLEVLRETPNMIFFYSKKENKTAILKI